MKVLIVDMTHGGLILASEFQKNGYDVDIWDIYNSLSDDEILSLENQGVGIVEPSSHPGKEILVIAPIHCNLPFAADLTHHQAVKLILGDEIKVPIIEVTGVKGKTSTVGILKEIFRNDNPLVLSSMGIEIINDGKELNLQENISITPANIIKAWRMAIEQFEPGIFILETSLGGTGLADVGVLTNLSENYSIAQGNSTASKAKIQIFQNKKVLCWEDAYHDYYQSEGFNSKTNLFGKSNGCNLQLKKVDYGFYKSKFIIDFIKLKTVNGKIITDSVTFETFAPASHHLENSLAAIGASLMLNKNFSDIQKGLNNFKGLKGRTSILEKNGAIIVQEINPGINLTAIKKSLNIFKDFNKFTLILGGQYGITCEEIDEKPLLKFLNKIDENIQLFLVDDLGFNLYKKLDRPSTFKDNSNEAIEAAMENNDSKILLIYRSHFANLEAR